VKTISLWQPWASAIALGSKRIETRSWSTKYRGPLAIHAAKRSVEYEFSDFYVSWHWCGALGRQMDDEATFSQTLPFGAIIATCTLIDCRPTESFIAEELDTPRRPRSDLVCCATHAPFYDWTERQMGDFSPGRWGWVMNDIKRLETPIPYRGKQGIFDIPDEMLADRKRVPV
jgi:hypothetical protein